MNVCGSGTDIKSPQLPFHVIISYYTSNSRVIHQGFGRTARNGREGTVQIIFLKEQYFMPNEVFEDGTVQNVLDDFSFKNKMQMEYIAEIGFFSNNIKTPKINRNYIKKMREAKI